ncbi:MAG TPA: PLP-dependent aminotransferase family protein [Terriglobales bacterium]|nr:PLP-dependent aminotransferase family protein [Terriglobales bacterium]
MKGPASVVFAPGALDQNSPAPLHRQLYEWYREAILSRQLRPGMRLPSTRSLAAELHISRIPILNAFEQLLAEGYVDSRVGAGTFVANAIPDELSRPRRLVAAASTSGRDTRRISRKMQALLCCAPQPWARIRGAFRASVPDLQQFPFEVWGRLVMRHARKPAAGLMDYSSPMGYLPFRKAIAEYLGTSRGVRCDPRQIMVVTGSQQGLQLSARVLLDTGSPVWIEEPGYRGAQQALNMAGARLVPVPVDDEGLNVAAGIRCCRSPRAIYVTPSHQYPTGVTLSAARRLRLLDWAARSGAWILEDDYDSEFRFSSRPIAALQGMDTGQRVIYIGTFSKVLFPALRLGYIVIPKDLVGAFVAAREAIDIFTSTLYQSVLADFISEGHFARHIRKMRMLYVERRNLLVEALRAELGDVLEILKPEAGMHLVAMLPPGLEDTAVAEAAAQENLSVMPLSFCYLRRAPRPGLILGYGIATPAQIQEGARRLAQVFRAMPERSGQKRR